MNKPIFDPSLFPEYRNVSNKPSHKYDLSVEVIECKPDDLESLIFAPDPITGVPRSDIALVLSKDTRPEVAQYIQDNLMRNYDPGINAGDDADMALYSIKDREESLESYASRLRELARSKTEDSNSNESAK